MDLFDSIVKALDHVATNASSWSRDSVVDAISLSKAMLDFEFIIALHVVERYSSYTENLTRSLQARALDILRAVNHIATLKQALTDAHSGIDEQFHSIYNYAVRRAGKHGVVISMPRRCSRQTARENHPGDTAEEYYCRSLAIPFLDHLKSDIESRFTSHSLLAINCLSIISSCFATAGAASDDEILEFFSSDINFKSTAKAELELWRSNFKDKELPDTPQSALKYTSQVLFPNIRKM